MSFADSCLQFKSADNHCTLSYLLTVALTVTACCLYFADSKPFFYFTHFIFSPLLTFIPFSTLLTDYSFQFADCYPLLSRKTVLASLFAIQSAPRPPLLALGDCFHKQGTFQPFGVQAPPGGGGFALFFRGEGAHYLPCNRFSRGSMDVRAAQPFAIITAVSAGLESIAKIFYFLYNII